MKQQKNDASRPMYVRVLCWILIILMVASALYTVAIGIQSLMESSRSNGTKKSLLLPVGETPAVLLSYEPKSDKSHI